MTTELMQEMILSELSMVSLIQYFKIAEKNEIYKKYFTLVITVISICEESRALDALEGEQK